MFSTLPIKYSDFPSDTVVNASMKINGQKFNETICLPTTAINIIIIVNNNNDNNNNPNGCIIIQGEIEESIYCWISSPLFFFIANEDNIRF